MRKVGGRVIALNLLVHADGRCGAREGDSGLLWDLTLETLEDSRTLELMQDSDSDLGL
jgi:hypothetical protein